MLSPYLTTETSHLCGSCLPTVYTTRQTLRSCLTRVPRFQGRPTEATGELERPAYGAVSARDYIPGAEVLDPENPTEDDGRGYGDEVSGGEEGRVGREEGRYGETETRDPRLRRRYGA